MTATDDIGVTLAQKRPACITCGKAKRKCSKQLPACNRCRIKKIRCVYAVAPVLFSSASQTFTKDVEQSLLGASLLREDTLGFRDTVSSSSSTGTIEPGLDKTHIENPWFLQPSSWEINHVHIDDDNHITYPDSGLNFFLDRMRTWLDQWTKEKHCVFIHSRLYATDLPSPLQYAYAAWLTYRTSETSSSRKTALQIALAWSKNLVQEQSIYDSLGDDTLDILNHLSRTQALLVFQFIGLFDGDIRARAEAEATSSTLVNWSNKLMQSAATRTVPHPPVGLDEKVNLTQIKQLCSDNTLSSTWKAWILSESIRRTWILATLTEAAFLILKQNFAICPGSIAFTGKSGLWDAPSPHAWLANAQKTSSVKTPVFCQGLSRLLNEATPSDTDDFTQALLMYGNGSEEVGDWLASES
jgi:hypothetical protein